MFEPKYKITEEILTNIVKFEVAKSTVEAIGLVDEWETRLKQEVFIKRVSLFSKIMGNRLDNEVIGKIVIDEPERDEKVAEMAQRLSIAGKEKELQGVLNIVNAIRYANHMVFLTNKFKDNENEVKELCQINSILGEKIYKSEVLGVYRTREAVGENFVFVPAVEVPYLLDDVLNWIAGVKKTGTNQLLNLGVLLYELVRILPFEENGLITVIEFLRILMATSGYELKRLWYLEEELLKNENLFWNAMTSVEKNDGDMTEYLEFFAKCLADGGERLKVRLVNLVGELPKFRTENGKVVALSERQIALMEEITVKGEMTIKELRSVLPMVSDDTILRDLKDLLLKKMIRKKGKTKGATYVLGKIKSFK